MATAAAGVIGQARGERLGVTLARADRAIGGPRFDALLIWGAPAIAFAITIGWMRIAALLPHPAADRMAAGFLGFVAILTYAHLIAVVPRAYLNAQVFARFPVRLVAAPLLLVAGFALSPPLLVAGMVLAVFWDVHHSAMQTFGLGRIYDMKAGNDPLTLRGIDLLLNSALYLGPILAGASMIQHVNAFGYFGAIGWRLPLAVPPQVAAIAGAVRIAGILLWLAIVALAAVRYRIAARAGYHFSAHKRALIVVTGSVSIAAWGLAPPFIAFAAINLFHAIQYFALVWLKEGGRIVALAGPRSIVRRGALFLFVAACFGFGTVYWLVMAAEKASAGAWLAPFIACSLLHFWYDGFVWSVRARQV